MKALPLLVIMLWPRLNIFKSRSNFKVKDTKSKNFGTHAKVLSQEMYILVCNMKVLPLLVRSYGQGQCFLKVCQISRSRTLGQKIL